MNNHIIVNAVVFPNPLTLIAIIAIFVASFVLAVQLLKIKFSDSIRIEKRITQVSALSASDSLEGGLNVTVRNQNNPLDYLYSKMSTLSYTGKLKEKMSMAGITNIRPVSPQRTSPVG